MKKLFLALAIICSLNSFATKRYIATSGSTYTSASVGDTFVLRSSDGLFHYASFRDITGSDEHPYVIINEGGVATMINGVSFYNCSHFKVTGSGTSSRYGIVVNDTTSTAITIYGISSYIEIERMWIKNKKYIAWVKNEVQNDEPPKCDTAYYWPHRITHIQLHDIRADSIHQDGFYLGSTASYGGASNGRGVSCGNPPVTIYPRPSGLGWIEVYNDSLFTIQRGGIQLSGCDTGVNLIHDNYAYNCGGLKKESGDPGSNVWPGIALGSATGNPFNTTVEIYNNTVKLSGGYGFYSYANGVTNFHDNVIDSSGYWVGDSLGKPGLHRNAGYANIMLSSSSSLGGMSFVIKNNNFGVNTSTNNPVYNIELLPTTPVHYNSTGNFICNNSPQNIHNPTPATFSLTCTSGCTINLSPVDNSTLTTSTTATLSWSSAQGATSYKLYFGTTGGTLSLITTTTALTYSQTGLTQNTSYTWYVTPTNSQGDATGCINDTTSFVTAVTATCTPPATLTTTNITQTGATANWTSVGSATSYDVQYRRLGTTTWVTSILRTTQLSRNITGLLKGTQYTWRVRSNCAGNTHSQYASKNFKTSN